MKIVIADDEHLIRLSLKHNLQKLPMEDYQIVEAANGVELLECLGKDQPDIAFVDIKMPLLGGLNAIEQGRSLSPHTEFVVLTGFAEFDYAQKAVDLQVHAYLLKPVSFEQLSSVMHSIRALLARRSAETNRSFISRVTAIVSDMAPVEDFHFPRGAMTCKTIAVCVDAPDGITRQAAAQKLESIGQYASDATNLRFHTAVIKPRYDMWLIVCGTYQNEEAAAGQLSSYTAEIIRKLLDQGKSSAAITLVTTGAAAMKELKAVSAELIRICSLRALSGTGKAYTLPFLKRQEQDKPYYLQISELLCELARHHYDQNHMGFATAAEEIFVLMEDNQLHDHVRVVQAVSRFLQHSVGFPLSPDLPYHRLKSELLNDVLHKLRSASTRTRLIESVVAYVNAHYCNEISVAGVAGLFDISPNYLSSLFHKHTGQKFVEYVTGLRMRKARRLLLETDWTVQEIASKVGLYSVSHFSKAFTKYYHKSPLEYRKIQLS